MKIKYLRSTPLKRMFPLKTQTQIFHSHNNFSIGYIENKLQTLNGIKYGVEKILLNV